MGELLDVYDDIPAEPEKGRVNPEKALSSPQTDRRRLPRVKEKIIDLETKFSFQEDLLQQLNKEMLLQQRQIDALSLQLRLVREQLSELLVQDGVHHDQPLEDEKPPHY